MIEVQKFISCVFGDDSFIMRIIIVLKNQIQYVHVWT